jgi:hypothetical protein
VEFAVGELVHHLLQIVPDFAGGIVMVVEELVVMKIVMR